MTACFVYIYYTNYFSGLQFGKVHIVACLGLWTGNLTWTYKS